LDPKDSLAATACDGGLPKFVKPQQVVEKRYERRQDKAKSDEKAQFKCNK
jgi:hypothetical protein